MANDRVINICEPRQPRKPKWASMAERLAESCQPDSSGCILWTKSVTHKGHGRLHIGGRQTTAHREAYRVAYGPIPEGMCVCHTCDVPRCINIEHLFLGTQVDNLADMVSKGRHAYGTKNGKSKLDADRVIEMRKQRANGAAYSSIAAWAGVSCATAYSAGNGKTWAHIEHGAGK